MTVAAAEELGAVLGRGAAVLRAGDAAAHLREIVEHDMPEQEFVLFAFKKTRKKLKKLLIRTCHVRLPLIRARHVRLPAHARRSCRPRNAPAAPASPAPECTNK